MPASYSYSSASSVERRDSAPDLIELGKAEAASFRDPGGCVVRWNGRVFRFIAAQGASDFDAFQQSTVARRLVAEGKVIGSQVLEDVPRAEIETALGLGAPVSLVLEHAAVRFPSYPYEWSPQMLYEAGMLTVDIAQALLEDGLGLKDATPYNVLFQGPRPVLIDVLSVERRDPLDALWLPYAQFIRTFCIPLLVNKRLGIPICDLLAGRRDGLEPEEVLGWLGPLAAITPSVLSTITVPALLGRSRKASSSSVYAQHHVGNADQAAFTLKMRYRSARRLLRKSRPNPKRRSEWSDYDAHNTYSAPQTAAKEDIIRTTVAEFACRTVLDIGCNTGRFSAAAVRGGAAAVVAVDRDPAVIDRLFREAAPQNLPILPLVIDFARPSPGIGWRNSEALSFFDRAAGRFDCVIALAFLHHMLVTERIPLRDVLSAICDLTTNLAIVEFVAPEDEMFRVLLRGRDELHRGLNAEVFEQKANRRFEIVRVHSTAPTRSLYVLRKR
jgi:SAM-dependent methyltransferase